MTLTQCLRSCWLGWHVSAYSLTTMTQCPLHSRWLRWHDFWVVVNYTDTMSAYSHWPHWYCFSAVVDYADTVSRWHTFLANIFMKTKKGCETIFFCSYGQKSCNTVLLIYQRINTLDSSNLGDTLCNISKSFSEFLVSFSKSGENFLKVPMLNNPIFTQGGNITRTFDVNYFIGENAQVKNVTLKQIS